MMLLLDNAPQKGTIYATFIDRMVYEKYEKLSDIEQYLLEDRLLELHLFDKEKELRFLKTREKGILRFEISDDTEYDDTYEECLYVSADSVDQQDNLTEKILVVNYIKYDKNDMLHIVNYRLKEVG